MCTEKFVRRDLVGEFHRRRATLQSDLGVTGALEHISVLWWNGTHRDIPQTFFPVPLWGLF